MGGWVCGVSEDSGRDADEKEEDSVYARQCDDVDIWMYSQTGLTSPIGTMLIIRMACLCFK